jgi:hypothetical protein
VDTKDLRLRAGYLAPKFAKAAPADERSKPGGAADVQSVAGAGVWAMARVHGRASPAATGTDSGMIDEREKHPYNQIWTHLESLDKL